MPILSSQSIESSAPITLLCGDDTLLIPSLIKQLIKKSHVVHVGKAGLYSQGTTHYTYVKSIDADLLKRLREKIEYAVCVVQTNEDKLVIKDIFDKLQHDHAKIVIGIPVRKLSQFADIIVTYKQHKSTTFLLIGDLFGSEVSSKQSLLQEIIQSALITKRVAMTGNDLSPIYPISLSDLKTVIHYLLFGDLKKSRLFFAFYETPQTIISLSHLIKRIEPELAIDFQKKETPFPPGKTHYELAQELYTKTLMHVSYPHIALKGFDCSVQELAHHAEVAPPPKSFAFLTPITQAKNIKVLRERLWINACIIGVLLFIFINILALITGIYYGKRALREFSTASLTEAVKSSKKSLIALMIARPALDVTSQLSSLVGINSLAQQYQQLNVALDTGNLIINHVAPVLSSIPQGINQKTFNTLLIDTTAAYFSLQHLVATNTNQLKPLTEVLSTEYSNILSVLPQILGYRGEKTYLILFQNNGELRPTGGFIGSLATVTLNNGKIKTYNIQDVYDPDGQLKAHIEPHYIVRRYLQPHMYLRDSNFDLSFQRDATYAAQLYNLETNTQVDGVLAVDFNVLKTVLNQTGPIYLPSFKKTLTADQAFEVLQDSIQTDFFPGSTKKKDILSELLTQLLNEVQSSEKAKLAIAKQFPTLMKEKHVLFAFRDISIQQAFTAQNLGGTLQDFRQVHDESVHDVLGINEANIGVNKANSALEREVEYQARIVNGKLTSTAGITYTNNFAKEYKAFVRIITPKNSILSSITINGVEQKIVPAITDYVTFEAKTFKPPDGLEVQTTQEEGYTTFGFITTVIPHTKSTVVVSYDNSISVPETSTLQYSLLFFKQPGTQPYNLTLSLEYPPEYTATSQNTQKNAQSVTMQEFVKTDTVLEIPLSKNAGS